MIKNVARPLRILLVEDDFDVAEGLAAFLEPHRVDIVFAYSVGEARAAVLEAPFDVIVLDVQLPDGNGLGLCSELVRDGLTTPVLFLTARGDLDDKLAGFAAGGIDYVVKPFAPAELLARVRAIAARGSSGSVSPRLVARDYVLEQRTGVLTCRGDSLALVGSARRIAEALIEASPGTVSRDWLNRLLWPDMVPESDPLRMHIHALRKSLQQTFGRDPIRTVRGTGYRFEASE